MAKEINFDSPGWKALLAKFTSIGSKVEMEQEM